MPEVDDTSLLLAAGTGDRQAFCELVELHQRAVMKFIHRFLGTRDGATAEDIAQEVFLAAWKASPRFEPKAAVQTWLLRITTNTCLNHKRSQRRHPSVPLVAEPPVGSGDNPGGEVVRRERAAKLEQAIAELPTNQRAAILLRHSHDLAYSEIAGVLGVSIPAVESLLFRARGRLGKIIGPDMG